jgi:hypothetical protein
MYGFRYHVVSLIAVFMALGFGILLGSSLGADTVKNQQTLLTDRLMEKYTQAKAKETSLDRLVRGLSQQVARDQAMMEQIARRYVAHRLHGRNIAIIRLGGTDVTAMGRMLAQADAAVKEEIVLWPQGGPVMAPSPEDAAGHRAPESGDVSLVRHVKDIAGAILDPGSQSLRTELANQGTLRFQGDFTVPPDAVVVVEGDSVDAVRRQTVCLPVVQTIIRHHIPVVVVKRSDSHRKALEPYQAMGMDTVDAVDTLWGQLALVDVLRADHKDAT